MVTLLAVGLSILMSFCWEPWSYRDPHEFCWWMSADVGLFLTGLELNGMGCTDKGETPPPLPLKGSTGDYGNLLEYQDLTSPSTPPPPPPHQRVGVLIRAQCNSLMMRGTWTEINVRYSHLTFSSTSTVIPLSSTPPFICSYMSTCRFSQFNLGVFPQVFCNMCHRRV